MTREEIEDLLLLIDQGLRSAQPSEIVGHAERALAAAESLGDKSLRFEAARKAGWARRLVGDSSAALAHFSNALASSADADPRLVFDTRIAWVVVARRVPGVPIARLLAVLDKARMDAGTDAHHQTLVLEERAGVLIDLGRTEEAWEVVEQARQVIKGLSGIQRFFSLLHIAWAARKLGQPARAMEWLAEARALPRSTWGVRGEAAYLTHLGHTALAMNQKEAALATAKTLWSMAEGLGQQIGIAAAGLLFEASRANDRWDDAAMASQRQLKLAREGGTVGRTLLWALLDQVEIDLHNGDHESAWSGLEEAEPIALRLDHDTGTEQERARTASVRARLLRSSTRD